MSTDGEHALTPNLAADPARALAGRLDPAWVIDPARGRVLAANAAGAARLGLRPDAASGTLDAAMPGLVRLRAMIRETLDGGRREPLVFWTAYGAESLLCDVAALPANAGTSTPPELVLVSIATSGSTNATASPTPKPGAISADGDEGGKAALASPLSPLPAPSAPNPDDAATLSKIANAIRNGFAGARSEPLPADAEDEDAASASAAEIERKARVSKLAHELRTPLSAIAAAAEIMRDQRFGALENERYLDYSSDIHDNARHALALISRLLGGDIADHASAAPEVTEIDLNALANSSVSAVRPLAEEAGLKLSVEFHNQLPLVRADATAIKQVLFNLLSNAIKFTPRDGDVRVVTGLGFNRSIFIAVQDTGSGMTAEQIEAVLKASVPQEPKPSTTGGLGIGLPLARSLAEANGARLEIDSATGEGTAVALVFPRDRIVPPPAASN
ncbi:sensor histidine kinase [Hyphomicrobium sulfonivorans]|nr:HAMP domain-containing sensor histidine kinase [Hyphomicrobium sulfonivorans]